MLEGIRVLELGQVLSAPFAGAILGDLGAEVLKIERVEGGDDARRMGADFRHGDALTFHMVNRNKKSVALDLKSEAGKADFEKLAASADILIHNLRPGSPEALGIDGKSLTARHPRLIYCAISAFGHIGPMKDRPGYEPLIQAYSGLSSTNGGPDDPPMRLGVAVCDQGTGMWIVIGALAALQRRHVTGRGAIVSASLLETALVWAAQRGDAWVNEGSMPPKHRSGHPALVPYEAFDAKDGPFIICCGNDRLFAKLSRELGKAEWSEDERFATNRARLNNKTTLTVLMSEILRTEPRASWIKRLESAGVPAAPINTLPEALNEPQSRALGILQDVPGEDYKLTGSALSFDGVRPAIEKRGAPVGDRNSGGSGVSETVTYDPAAFISEPRMPGPLHGYRVVDLTSNVSGPLATMILADQGADVIKVENPDGGDATRAASNRRNGLSASFLNTNRNKRSVALDLRDPAAKQALLRLIATADVFIQNFRPGVAARMGFGEDALRVVKPDIVYVSISGFGETGPYASKPVYDPIIQAMSSLATIQAGSDTERPRLVRTILPDKLTAVTASQAITAALLARERTGQGQHVRLSMLDAVIAFLWPSDMGSQTFADAAPPRQEPASQLDLIYATATDYITVAVQTDRQWLGLIRALEKPEWLDDPRFRTPALRQENVNERLAMTQAVLKTRSATQWLEVLTKEDVPCAPVLTRSALLHDDQVQANGIIVETLHEQVGPLRQARPAARFSVTPAEIRHGAPVLGQDTATILEELGYSAAEIAVLRAKEYAA